MPSSSRIAHSTVARPAPFLALVACLSSSALCGQTGRIEGTVKNAATGVPVAAARVGIFGTVLVDTTGADGAFSLGGLAAGVYDIYVQAQGFESILQLGHQVGDSVEPKMDFELRSLVTAPSRKVAPPPRAPAVFLPGLGLGVTVSLEGGGGRTDDAIESAAGFDGILRYGFGSGLFVNAGLHVGRHNIATADYPYQLVRAYVEPRYVAQWISQVWAPFVAGQVGHVWETVDRYSMSLRASGLSLGGGGGVALHLTPQLTLEGGALVGTTHFGDYTFKGERAWYECLNLLEPGTPLPESVQHCAGTINAGAVLCYPPFYSIDRLSGDCRPPDIPHGGTGRSASWLRLWFGASVSFASPR